MASFSAIMAKLIKNKNINTGTIGILTIKALKKAAGSLGLAFLMAALPIGDNFANAARNTEPYSCTVGGRHYDPQPASIAVDVENGDILSGADIDTPRHPASMTKMMTTLLIFDALRDGRLTLSDEITVKITDEVRATKRNSRSTWVKDGTKITVEEAILAIAVASANNISVMMAEKLAGSEQAFAALMNEKAQDLGMRNTLFKNASGLPDKDQVSTARDMAKLALHLYHEFPEYYHYFSAPKAEFGPWQGTRAKHNHNELAVKNNDIDGIKTGFICDSGYNLAASAKDGSKSVITIVFGGRTPHQRNEQTKNLIQEGFQVIIARDAEEKVKLASHKDFPNIHDDIDTRIVRQTQPNGTTPVPVSSP